MIGRPKINPTAESLHDVAQTLTPGATNDGDRSDQAAPAMNSDHLHLPGLEASLDLVSRLSAELARQAPPYRRTAYGDPAPLIMDPIIALGRSPTGDANWVSEENSSQPKHSSLENGRKERAPFNHIFFNQLFLQKIFRPRVVSKKIWLIIADFFAVVDRHPHTTISIGVVVVFALGFNAGLVVKTPAPLKPEIVSRTLSEHVQSFVEDVAPQGPVVSVKVSPILPGALSSTPPSVTIDEPSTEKSPENFDIKLPITNTAAVPAAAPQSTPNSQNVSSTEISDSSRSDVSSFPAMPELAPVGSQAGEEFPTTGSGDDVRGGGASTALAAPVPDQLSPSRSKQSFGEVPPVPQMTGATNDNLVTGADLTMLRVRFYKNPTDDLARVDLANALARAVIADQDVSSVADELQSLANNRPKNAPIQAALGRFFAAHNDMYNSTIHFNRAIQLDDKNTGYRLDLAIVYDHAGNAQQALSLYREVIRMATNGDEAVPLSPSLGATQNRARYLDTVVTK